MSAFVLNRNYELVLPNSYVNIENEEMEYVDGEYIYQIVSLTNFLKAFGCSVIISFVNSGASAYAIAKKVKTVFNIIKAGLASTGWEIAIPAYLGWEGGSFINEFSKALDKGIGLNIGCGWNGSYFEAQ